MRGTTRLSECLKTHRAESADSELCVRPGNLSELLLVRGVVARCLKPESRDRPETDPPAGAAKRPRDPRFHRPCHTPVHCNVLANYVLTARLVVVHL